VALRKWLLARAGPRILLAFSRGKDALAAWVALLEDGFEVFPYHLDLVPGLKFVDESLDYFERKFKPKIHRFPHPQFVRMLDNTVLQAPHDWHILNQHHHTIWKFPDLEAYMREVSGGNPYLAIGVRAADNPLRRLVINKHGPVNERKRTVYPVFDWKIIDVRSAMARHGIELPVDYELWNRSFDGINLRYLGPLKERFPEDYQRMLLWFPLLEAEFRQKEYADHGY